MSQSGRHLYQTAHLSRAWAAACQMRLERLPFRRRQRAQDVRRRLVAELIVPSHSRIYGARTGRDGCPAEDSGQHAGRQVLLGWDDQDHLGPLLATEHLMVRVGVGMYEVAGAEPPPAGDDAP